MLTYFHNGGILGDIESLWERIFLCIFLDLLIYSIEAITAERYSRSKKARWGIENSLHWVLDIGFREDEGRIRAGNAAENMNMAG